MGGHSGQNTVKRLRALAHPHTLARATHAYIFICNISCTHKSQIHIHIHTLDTQQYICNSTVRTHAHTHNFLAHIFETLAHIFLILIFFNVQHVLVRMSNVCQNAGAVVVFKTASQWNMTSNSRTDFIRIY